MSSEIILPEKPDVVVIGGGIIDCSTAYYPARDGVSVTLCGKADIAAKQPLIPNTFRLEPTLPSSRSL